LKNLSDLCKDELPIALTYEHDQILEIMNIGGDNSVLKAKAVLESVGVDEKCVVIFGLICFKAESSDALNIIKQACMNLWI
jgi:hypothetical protein